MFLDAVVSDRKGAAHELTMKLLVKDNAFLDDAVRAALSTYGRSKAKENPGNDTSVDVYMTRIKYVMCKSTDLGDFVTEPEARIDASVALQQKYESVSERFTCGDLLFPDNHPFSRLLAQRTNINCESQIEKAYFNVPVRGFKTQDICIHCGEGCREERKSDFLLRQEELQERNATEGYPCYPICTMCLDGGKKVVRYNGRKPNLVQAVKEKNSKKASGKKSIGKSKK